MTTDQSMLAAVLETLPDPGIVTDARRHIVLVNRATAAAFGYDRTELLGRPLDLLLPPDVSHGQPVARRKDGSEFPAEVRAQAIRLQSGALEIACIRDATARRGRGSLPHDLERLATFGLLAAEVAQESRNALAILSSRLDLMLLEADETGLPSVVREDLVVLQRSARRLAATFERLLRYAAPSPDADDPTIVGARGGPGADAISTGKPTCFPSPALMPVRVARVSGAGRDRPGRSPGR